MRNKWASTATPLKRRKGLSIGAALFIFLPLSAQPISFNVSGNPACIGTPWTDPNLPPAYPSLIFGTTVHCRIPLAPGSYQGSLIFVEPNKTATGQRIFTVSVQGQTSLPVDVFAAAGLDKPYAFPFVVTINVPGVLDIVLTASMGNAVLSAIQATPISATQAFLSVLTPPSPGPCPSPLWLGTIEVDQTGFALPA